jgi:hypothetical protein
MLLQVQGRRLQIQDPQMLYFLTYPVYFIDIYNVIEVFGKYLREYFASVLTNDNKIHKMICQVLHMKKRYYEDDLWRGPQQCFPP